jgi:glycosyltransferase involved in cell wall biosynthesis
LSNPTSSLTVLYSAAHGGFAHETVPLGGGATICNQLVAEWQRTKPFSVRLLDPALLGAGAPKGRDLVRFGERQYAQFCFDFEEAVTREVLRHDPANTVVLSNDISEGPAFQRLHAAGFPIYTIYHVDVVAYVAAIYARSLQRPETMVRWYDRVERSAFRSLMPRLPGLIFRKQRESVEYSRGVILPSAGMSDVLRRCYPALPVERIHVFPWGTEPIAFDSASLQAETTKLRREFYVPEDALVLLTLSRISPEKGQDALLKALLEWERRGELPQRPLYLFLCGDAAFMMGQRYLNQLRALAGGLKRIAVIFPGYVTGLRKHAFLELADLYVFPSKHESYGLTLLEALRAGLPAICLDHHGAREVMREEFGEIVAPEKLLPALRGLLADQALRERKGAAARAYAATQDFSNTAARLADLLRKQ